MVSSLAIVVGINLFCICNASSPRIVGGRRARLGEFPMVAEIVRISNHQHICGGFVVSQRIVMSAAHCFQDCYDFVKCRSYYRVMVGDVKRKLDGNSPKTRQVRFLTKLIPHEQFDPATYHNDIILMELHQEIYYSKNVNRSILAKTRPPVGDKCIVVGWGHQKFDAYISPNYLQATSIPIVAPEVCGSKFDSFKSHIAICAGDVTGKNDSCHGDSGGPLICQGNVVAGIVSYGKDCAVPGYAAVYTDISAYQQWISDKTRKRDARNGSKYSFLTFTYFEIIAFIVPLKLGNFET